MVYSTCRCLSDCGSSMTPSVPAPHPKWLGKSIHLATQGLLNHFSGHKKPVLKHQNDFLILFSSREQANLFYEMAFDGLFFGRLDYREKDQRLLAKRGEMLWQTTSKGKFQLKEDIFDAEYAMKYKIFDPSSFSRSKISYAKQGSDITATFKSYLFFRFHFLCLKFWEYVATTIRIRTLPPKSAVARSRNLPTS